MSVKNIIQIQIEIEIKIKIRGLCGCLNCLCSSVLGITLTM